MRKLSDEEGLSIKGGAGFSIWAGIVIAALAIFVSGIIEGVTNPAKCSE